MAAGMFTDFSSLCTKEAEDEDLCPHCSAKVHREMMGHQQIMPASCDNGCREFYGTSDNARADDEEILAGWWKHEGLEVSNISLFRKPDDVKWITQRREAGLAAAADEAEKEREVKARYDALREEARVKKERYDRYQEEALF